MYADICRLTPHEADDQDVILLGHSMGGLIASDIALWHDGAKPKHKILGLVNFDTPFLGLDPGVFSTGLATLFQKNDETPEEKLADQQKALEFEAVYNDPNFNPSDHLYPESNVQWRDGTDLPHRSLIKGTKNCSQKKIAKEKRRADKHSLKSRISAFAAPMKFASGVRNHSELRQRYKRLKDLEKAEHSPERLRFINYYTSSTGCRELKGAFHIPRETQISSSLSLTLSQLQKRRPKRANGRRILRASHLLLQGAGRGTKPSWNSIPPQHRTSVIIPILPRPIIFADLFSCRRLIGKMTMTLTGYR